jgi:hypothetical protein
VTAKPYTPLTMTQEMEKVDRSIKHWRLPNGETVLALWNALMRSFAELDATRATLAEVTRERDERVRECEEWRLYADEFISPMVLGNHENKHAMAATSLRRMDPKATVHGANGAWEKHEGVRWVRPEALAASQAECAALREAGKWLCGTAQGVLAGETSDLSLLHESHGRMADLLSRAPGSTDALREFGVRVGDEVPASLERKAFALESGTDAADNDWALAQEYKALARSIRSLQVCAPAAIVDRILGRAGSGGTT